jgi:circadian clock protein KaiC
MGQDSDDVKSAGKSQPFGPDRAGPGGFGLRTNRTVLLIGPPGSGKTVFSLQNLVAAVQAGQTGIFLSFAEAPARIRESAASFGWDVAALEEQKRLLIHARVRPHVARGGHFAIEAVLSALTTEIRASQVRHVVLDGLQVVLALLDTRLARLQAAFRLRDWIHENNLSAVLTYSLSPPGQPPSAAIGPEVIECIADCVVALSNPSADRPERRLRFVRYRCAELPAVDYPIRITSTGVEVLAPPSAAASGLSSDPEFAEPRRILSTGLRQLHCFLEAKQTEFDLLIERRDLAGAPLATNDGPEERRAGLPG